jgi:hypothetical protein
MTGSKSHSCHQPMHHSSSQMRESLGILIWKISLRRLYIFNKALLNLLMVVVEGEALLTYKVDL